MEREVRTQKNSRLPAQSMGLGVMPPPLSRGPSPLPPRQAAAAGLRPHHVLRPCSQPTSALRAAQPFMRRNWKPPRGEHIQPLGLSGLFPVGSASFFPLEWAGEAGLHLALGHENAGPGGLRVERRSCREVGGRGAREGTQRADGIGEPPSIPTAHPDVCSVEKTGPSV